MQPDRSARPLQPALGISFGRTPSLGPFDELVLTPQDAPLTFGGVSPPSWNTTVSKINLESLMFQLLADAQEFFGPRDPQYTVAIETGDVPNPVTVTPNPAIVDRNPDCLLIRIPAAVVENDELVHAIGHEVGHVVCGPAVCYTTNLEEGACEVNAIASLGRYSRDHEDVRGFLPNPRYWRAEYYVFRLLDHNKNAIRLIRERQSKLSVADADLICECVPSIDRRLAEKLATKFGA